MGGYVANDAVASATRSPLSLKRHSMLTWTEKGERLDGEMHSRNLFSDAYTRQVEALTHKSPFRRFIQSTHTSTLLLKNKTKTCYFSAHAVLRWLWFCRPATTMVIKPSII